MPVFINHARKYLLITNYKVMYSTLSQQKNLTKLPHNKLYISQLLIYHKIYTSVMLVRNPYYKLISFFEDKFRRHPLMLLSGYTKRGNYDGWQDSQKIFFPYLDISKSADRKTVATRLIDTSFADFISCLPYNYLLDAHLHPQVNIIQLKYKSFLHLSFNLNINKIIKMESLERDYLTEKLDLDLNIAFNKNPKQNILWQDYFTSPLLKIVNDLYQHDFSRFNYQQYASPLQI